MTQAEVAKAIGVSRGRVAQIEAEALKKIRESGKLDKFIILLRR
jgi:DNA-directed RNA polymerase sigma subunit (sigma70/sigma32)